MEETGETANLAVARENHVMFVSQAECHHSVRAFFPPGTQSPMHASGIGKALLAEMGDSALDAYLASTALEAFLRSRLQIQTHCNTRSDELRLTGMRSTNKKRQWA